MTDDPVQPVAEPGIQAPAAVPPAAAEAAPAASLAAPPRTGGAKRIGDRAVGVGRRKTAIARVTLAPGTGRIIVNGKTAAEYFQRPVLLDIIQQPFTVTGTVKRFDVTAVLQGAGPSAQAGAVRLGIARALAAWQPDLRPALGTAGLLTRDPRMVERKKYGIRGARRRPQWTKR